MSSRQGQLGEEAAVHYLQQLGYQILARNVRLGRGELDIVACQGDILAFVEVKYHKQRQHALQAVHRDKRRRLIQAASLWLAHQREHARARCRFDVILVSGQVQCFRPLKVEHIPDAFRPD